jgi:hypothetical protein
MQNFCENRQERATSIEQVKHEHFIFDLIKMNRQLKNTTTFHGNNKQKESDKQMGEKLQKFTCMIQSWRRKRQPEDQEQDDAVVRHVWREQGSDASDWYKNRNRDGDGTVDSETQALLPMSRVLYSIRQPDVSLQMHNAFDYVRDLNIPAAAAHESLRDL